MKTLLILAIALICSNTLQAETPQEASKAIHALLVAKDYKTLFTTRYSEWHKVAKDGVEPDKAVEKLSSMFEKKHVILVDLYKSLSTAKFEMGKNEHAQESETGKTATAQVPIGDKEIPFTLYEMKNGKWGFHL